MAEYARERVRPCVTGSGIRPVFEGPGKQMKRRRGFVILALTADTHIAQTEVSQDQTSFLYCSRSNRPAFP